jgi:ribonuclease HI
LLHSIYLQVPYICQLLYNSIDFFHVDVKEDKHGVKIVGDMAEVHSIQTTQQPPKSLAEALTHLDPSLQQICGNVIFLGDNGAGILSSGRNPYTSIYGSSDASLKDGRATHAWDMSTGQSEHLEDPTMHIKECGPVDGIPSALSSLRGELTGITAVLTISRLLLEFHSCRRHVKINCDNKGAIQRCAKGRINSHWQHIDANVDLYLTQHEIRSSIPISLHWVKSHQDTEAWDTVSDLQSQGLTNDAIYNVWCDRAAAIAWEQVFPSNFDPVVTPAEKWALFTIHPSYHKIICDMNSGLYNMIAFHALSTYIMQKHSIPSSGLDKINTLALKTVLTGTKNTSAGLNGEIDPWMDPNVWSPMSSR